MVCFQNQGSVGTELGPNYLQMLSTQGGGVLQYFHKYVGSGYFLGFKILNFNIFLVLRNVYFLGYEDLVDIFWGSSQNWASLRVISMHFRVFFKARVQNWDIFWAAKISNIFLGCLKFLIYFWGER